RLLCYCSLVDEFQHWVYRNPEASLDQRDSQWVNLWDKYMPGLDWRGAEKYKATRWYAQNHIFRTPFYYIDYALASTVAMQLALINTANHKAAVNKYLQMCQLGGTKSFVNAVTSSGLRSPFEES